ncbi:hypothetical protein K466DRAFT_528721 [Polyporus arcularius HHB13444]|uniref:Uncharacterized protein n=1 Tax=Polyporus arcularius HHB13444 TaxID=1314778 RepID=A0A5C3P5H2_9APHY|nr:hypothetical protein K466DRAFT_528721 [Polyporus arcularius HHB13444]
MESRNPALWENGQYLEEWDPANGNKFSDAARKAQAAKLQRLIRNRPPRNILPRSELPNRRVDKPPLYYYGFPFTKQYAVDYAKRHRLTIELVDEDREAFDGKEVFDFGDVDDKLMSNPDLRRFVNIASQYLMVEDLSKRCRMRLQSGRPFCLEWDGIVALWSNFDVKERYARCYNYDAVVETLTSAMNEGDGPESKLQWWYDWDNDVGVLRSID